MAIALELKARGHHPLIATTPIYREKIEALGLAFFGSTSTGPICAPRASCEMEADQAARDRGEG